MAALTYSDLQVVPSEYSDLQVVPGRGLEVVQEDRFPKERTADSASQRSSTQSRIFGLKRKTFWITLVVLLVVLAGALGGGIGGGLSASHKDNNKAQEAIASTTSYSTQTTDSKTSSTPIVTSDRPTPVLTTRTVVLPTATLLRDCPSSNNTLYDVDYGSEEPLIFRKYCVSGLRHDINGRDVLNEPTKSLNDCIQTCADYNDRNKTEIASGESQVCNAVCWRSDEEIENINQIPGQCFGYTTINTTAGAQVTNETLCDSAIWINQRNL
ncbi:hypothetical protein BDV96DRAFT_561209 [Lophiotrema nucula]|uniref:Apple domain-containing protein n=1 Tax=Lophiotrema nucula TaxID=690887 RepID=A0A6A5ZSP7_9PLEO|nr:hypothetical protein BDV96DRAFT_561209 [Lophiotrema nucula]